MKELWHWFLTLVSGRPHFTIGGKDRPYMLRWHLIPKNRLVNVYLHNIRRDDDDRAKHDHPWWFLSVLLRGCYLEHRSFLKTNRYFVTFVESQELRKPLSVAIRRATDRHRIELPKDEKGQPVPCWTLVITGPNVREWGFWCGQRFVHWKQFCAPHNSGEVGRGCE